MPARPDERDRGRSRFAGGPAGRDAGRRPGRALGGLGGSGASRIATDPATLDDRAAALAAGLDREDTSSGEGEHAMSLIETLAGELAPEPVGSRLAHPELALAPAARSTRRCWPRWHTRRTAGSLREPRFRAWLRAEWTAWARQRYRRVAKRRSRTGPATLRPLTNDHDPHHDPRHPRRTGEAFRRDRRGRRRIARAAAGRDDVRAGSRRAPARRRWLGW